MAAAANDLYNLMMSGGSFKIVDVSTLGDGILPVEKLAQFIRVIRENSPVLGEATYKKINGDSLAISRIQGNVTLTPGRDNTGAKRAVPDDDQSGVEIKTNSLVPKELIAKMVLDYDALEDNLEQDAFESTLMDEFGLGTHEQLERYFWFADTSISWSTTNISKLLSINNGWLKTAGNKIYGLESATGAADEDFNPDSDQDMWPIPLFKKLYSSIPRKFIAGKQNRSQYRLYVTSEVEEAYSDIVGARPTLAGDNALLGKDVLAWKGIPVIDIPSFEDTDYTAVSGTPCVLTKPANMYWGTKRDIMVENQKDIDMRQIKNVLSMRGDCTYENEDMTAVAYLDKKKPAS